VAYKTTPYFSYKKSMKKFLSYIQVNMALKQRPLQKEPNVIKSSPEYQSHLTISCKSQGKEATCSHFSYVKAL
jgi:hypothetical protein